MYAGNTDMYKYNGVKILSMPILSTLIQHVFAEILDRVSSLWDCSVGVAVIKPVEDGFMRNRVRLET